MKKAALLMLFNALILIGLKAQETNSINTDTLTFLNGEFIRIKTIDVNDLEITYEMDYKGKILKRTTETNGLFSLKQSGKSTRYFYRYDESIGNYYTIDEMKDFIIGEQDARSGYKSPIYNILGIGAGIAGGYLLGNDESVAGFAPPMVYSLLTLATGASVKKNSVRNEKYLNNDPYRAGYKRVAKGKKFTKALKYSILSFGASSILFAVIK